MVETPNGGEFEPPFYRVQANTYPIPADLARELAAVIIEWGALETVIALDLEQLRVHAPVRKLSDIVPSAFGAKLKLWRRSYSTLFPSVTLYQSAAEEIFTKTREVGLARHKIIHGLWRHGGDKDPEAFSVVAGLDRPKDVTYFRVDAKLLGMLATDIRTLKDYAWSLNATRQLHAVQGLLQRQPAPLGEHPAPPPPPIPEKP